MLASEAAVHAPSTEGDNDELESDDEEWNIGEFMEEDIYFMTPLDDVNPYTVFVILMNTLTERGLGPIIESSMTPEKRVIVSGAFEAAQKAAQKSATVHAQPVANA